MGSLKLSLDVAWCETWYVNLFVFVFGKMKVLEWPLSQKREKENGYKFDKWEDWTCPLIWKMICEPILF